MGLGMHFLLNSFMQKTVHSPLHFYIQTLDTLRHIFIHKKQCNLRHVYIYIIYCIVFSDT